MWLEDFHFLRPLWLIALPVLGFVIWRWYHRTQGGSGWDGRIEKTLLNALIDSSHIRSGRILLATVVLTACLAVISVAGPTWEKLPQNVEQKQDTLIILLDLSLSMLATDVGPSRLDRARQEVADILRLRKEGETALIAYAGDAHAVVPLTDDVATIENLLFSLSPEMMPVFGSNPGHALELAQELFTNSGYLQGRILLVTDGIDEISSVSRYRSAALPISILGVGTPDGAAIPLDRLRQPGKFLLTQEGNRIIALLDEQRMREVVSLTYGRYHRAEVGDQDIAYALSSSLPSDDETIDVEREFDTWADQGHWLAVLVIPLFVLAFRRGVFVSFMLILCLPAQELRAQSATSFSPTDPPTDSPTDPPTDPSTDIAMSFLDDAWQSLWQRPDQRGVRKLTHGQPEQAAVLFADPLFAAPQWRASAQYRSSDYASALAGFNEDRSATGSYNQGNALARLGEHQLAIEAYAETLSEHPGHEDAAFNKELVERLLQEKQDAEQQNNEQQNQADNQDSESQQDQQQKSQEQQEQQAEEQASDQKEEQEQQEQSSEQQQEGKQQQSEEKQEQASRDEKQEALEQWLRRVPDDPGGLLRRKFSHETRDRLRRGEYNNRQGEKQW